eukprot:1158689-Pelagomonas_calceolata.AAC.10
MHVYEQEAKAVVEKDLGKPIDEIFSEWGDKPIAAASLAQVLVIVKFPRKELNSALVGLHAHGNNFIKGLFLGRANPPEVGIECTRRNYAGVTCKWRSRCSGPTLWPPSPKVNGGLHVRIIASIADALGQVQIKASSAICPEFVRGETQWARVDASPSAACFCAFVLDACCYLLPCPARRGRVPADREPLHCPDHGLPGAVVSICGGAVHRDGLQVRQKLTHAPLSSGPIQLQAARPKG